MNYLLTFLIYLAFNPGLAEKQEGDTITHLMNGYVRFEGVDPLGADVMVVYNDKFEKVYQERTTEGLTTYVKYNEGEIIDYGERNARIKTKRSDYLTMN